MRIGIDLCDLSPGYGGGTTSFAFGLMSGLMALRRDEDRFVLLVTSRNEAFLRQALKDANVDFLNVPAFPWNRAVNSVLGLSAWLTGNFKLRFWYDRLVRRALMRKIDEAMDVLVAPLSVLRFYGMTVPALVCIHDIQQEYHPEHFTWRDRVSRWDRYRLSAWRATAIQASSQYIKDCMIEKFSFLDAKKLVLIPEGVDFGKFSGDAFCESPLAELRNRNFVYYPAQIWPHKNHLMLIDALARYRDDTGGEMVCVLTGRDYGHWAAVREHIASYRLQQVHYLGLVPFPQLIWLYRNCRAVLALGMHESSSLPVREGAAFGKALICLDIPPNREAAASLRLKLVDRTDPSVLARALMALAGNSEDVVGWSAENARLARSFDWRNIARAYELVLQAIVAGRALPNVHNR